MSHFPLANKEDSDFSLLLNFPIYSLFNIHQQYSISLIIYKGLVMYIFIISASKCDILLDNNQ